MSQQAKSRTCTITITEMEDGVAVDAGFSITNLRDATISQTLAMVGVTAIHEKMIEYREKAAAETTH
ncbi:hypothetical protein [Salinicola sp. RZ23]|uniref:hypothetical protein n=1 Tax=Salinicola sp. RZ23 TaxID=1949087 RepID=UPI000DA1F996|nr:hypothetical protein [Salinicola sp. RZ23]